MGFLSWPSCIILCYSHFHIIFKRTRLWGSDIVWNPQSSMLQMRTVSTQDLSPGSPMASGLFFATLTGREHFLQGAPWLAHDFFHKWPIPATLVLHLRGRRPGGAHQQTRTGHRTVGKGNAWGKAKTALRHINPRPWERRASNSLPSPWRGRPPR